MEYGVFAETSANWLAIFIGIALLGLFVFSVIAAVDADVKKKRKVSLFGESRTGYKFHDTTNASIGFGVMAGFALVFGLVFIFVGSCSKPSEEELAGQGKYKIVESYLVFSEETHKDVLGSSISTNKNGVTYYSYSPTLEKPLYFELKLEGREKSSHPSDLRIVQTVEIPYDRIVESYKYKAGIEKPADIVLDKNYGTVSLPVNLPAFIVKKDNLWILTEAP